MRRKINGEVPEWPKGHAWRAWSKSREQFLPLAASTPTFPVAVGALMDERSRRREPGGAQSCPLAGFLAATLLSAAIWALLYALWCAVGA